jgi:hypothetical protein
VFCTTRRAARARPSATWNTAGAATTSRLTASKSVSASPRRILPCTPSDVPRLGHMVLEPLHAGRALERVDPLQSLAMCLFIAAFTTLHLAPCTATVGAARLAPSPLHRAEQRRRRLHLVSYMGRHRDDVVSCTWIYSMPGVVAQVAHTGFMRVRLPSYSPARFTLSLWNLSS